MEKYIYVVYYWNIALDDYINNNWNISGFFYDREMAKKVKLMLENRGYETKVTKQILVDFDGDEC